MRLRKLPFDNQTARALRNTTTPTSLIPLSSGYEIVVPRAKTRLQAVQLRNSRLTNGAYKAQIKEATEKAWEQHFEKARTKNTPHHSQSYYARFPFKAIEGADLVRGKRSLTSAFYSLKLGHGYFRSYLYRLHKVDHFRCRCGNKETPEHLLLSCPLYQQERPLALQSAPTLQALLLTQNGADEVICFIKTTKIGTQLWY